ncbi:MAG: asparagine synthase-related protein [Halodesulfovibrio sp.]|uniref:asparagine synthase-related protein n=1 Tax=Halodesulfovibrio sp. TaxID=1912772 RepID=UPI00359CCC00
MSLPGITAIIGDVKNGEITDKKKKDVVFFTGKNVKGYVSYHNAFNHEPVYYDEISGVGVCCDGRPYKYGLTGNCVLSKDIVKDYLSSGMTAIQKYSGSFNILIWNNNTGHVEFINDKYCLRPMFYVNSDCSVYLSTSAKRVADLVGMTYKLNDEFVYNALSYSRIGLCEDSIFEGVKYLQAATHISYHSTINVKKYFSYNELYCSGEPCLTPKDMSTFFQELMGKYTSNDENIGVNLSGGLDSRMLICSMNEAEKKRTTSFTWGYSENNSEISLAKDVARSCNTDWQFIELAPNDFIRRWQEGVALLEGRDLFVQSYGLSAFPIVKNKVDISLTGLALDVTLGGSYYVDSSNTGVENGPFDQILRRFNAFKNHNNMFLHQKLADSYVEQLKTNALERFNADASDDANFAIDHFVFKSRVERILNARQSWQRLYVEDLCPTFDDALLEEIYKIPFASKKNHKFYRDVMLEMSADCSTIPYQSTMLPVQAPIEFWAKSAELEAKREGLLRELYYKTNGNVFVGCDRYYSNFDEWLRVESSWVELTNQMLLSNDSILAQQYISHDWLKKVIDQHRSGEQSHYGVLIQLLTVEMTLRWFHGL